MRQSLAGWTLVCAVAGVLAGCGGGGGGSSGGTIVTPPQTVSAVLAAAAADPKNDTATNSAAPFTVLQGAGVAAVTIKSPPKVNFAIFSDGKVKTDVAIASMSIAIAKLVPGTNGNIDQWVNYVYRTETATPGVGPGGKPVLASAKQATTDPKQTDAALLAQQLVVNPSGYYTYTFRTDITNTAQTNGVVFEPLRTHRIAIQLTYVNAAGETIKVNPYFDFTIGGDGNSVALTDPAQTRKMTDVASCNGCHDKLGLHGGGRVDTQYCVMCHNAGTTDANSGNVLIFPNMVHKIHAGKLLKKALDDGKGGEDFTIWGFNNQKVSFAEVGFPQDLRNCTKCHDGANPATPQADLWKSRPSQEACLSCHASGANSDWVTRHDVFAGTLVGAGATAKQLTNAMCADCHKVGSNISPERVHWNQNEENAAKYKMNIEDASYDPATRKVRIRYFLSDPTNSNAAYNLVTSECTGSGATVTCSGTTRFGNLRFYLGFQSQVGQPASTTEYTGGSNVNQYAYKGVNDGSNHYTVDLQVPPDTATSVTFGTARVVSVGQVKEAMLEVKAATDPRPEAVPRTLINVGVQNTWKELALTGVLQPRRQVVATEKCNVCHGLLGTTTGSNSGLSEAFHGGARNITEACVVCHDVNKVSSTVMTNGLDLNESYQLKRMIHGIHGNSERTYPFTHGNTVIGVFNKDGTSATGGAPLAPDVDNYAAEVSWPGVGINCNACHVNNSYKQDRGVLGAVVKKPAGVTDPNGWLVISPKAATCTACHDSSKAMGHVTSFGGATFSNATQAQMSALPRESCDDCHSSGGFKGVDIVHGQK